MRAVHFLISLLSLIFLGQILSCSSLKTATLLENPEFERTAEKFVITSPLSHSPSQSNKFIVENISANTVFEIETRPENPQIDRNTIEAITTNESQKTKSREFVSHKFFIARPLFENYYEVIGKTTRFQTEENKAKSGSVSSSLVYPLEFWIFEDGKDIGRIIVSSPDLNLIFAINASIHGQQLDLKYQAEMSNTKSVSIEGGQGLLAFLHSKPAGFITTKQKGEFFIKQGLAEELKSDILVAYMIVETVMGIISE